jgi:hypothetical protein
MDVNGTGSYARPRNPGDGPGPGNRYPSGAMRGPAGLMSPALAPPAPSPINRAERFEDEKRRIIESCFAKVDAEQHGKSLTHLTYLILMG